MNNKCVFKTEVDLSQIPVFRRILIRDESSSSESVGSRRTITNRERQHFFHYSQALCVLSPTSSIENVLLRTVHEIPGENPNHLPIDIYQSIIHDFHIMIFNCIVGSSRKMYETLISSVQNIVILLGTGREPIARRALGITPHPPSTDSPSIESYTCANRDILTEDEQIFMLNRVATMLSVQDIFLLSTTCLNNQQCKNSITIVRACADQLLQEIVDRSNHCALKSTSLLSDLQDIRNILLFSIPSICLSKREQYIFHRCVQDINTIHKGETIRGTNLYLLEKQWTMWLEENGIAREVMCQRTNIRLIV